MGAIRSSRSCLIVLTLLFCTTIYTMDQPNTKEVIRSMYCSVVANLLKAPTTKNRERGRELIIEQNLTQQEIPTDAFNALPIKVQDEVKTLPIVAKSEKNILTNRLVINDYQSPSSSPQSNHRSRSNSQLDPKHRSRTSSETSETSVSSTPTLSRSKLSQYVSLNPEGGSDDEKDNEEKEWCMIDKEE